MSFIPYSYPHPPKAWDPSWASSLLRALEDAALLRARANEIDYTVGQEMPVGGRWTDGRALWMRVVPITRAFIEGSTEIAHGIAGLQTVVRLSGAFNNGGSHNPLPWFSVGGPMVLIRVTSTGVASAVTGGTLWPDFAGGHVIIEYTRS